MDQYKQTEIFSESLQEFDDSEETVRNLIEEYEAAESQNYLDWGAMEEMKDDNDGMNFWFVKLVLMINNITLSIQGLILLFHLLYMCIIKFSIISSLNYCLIFITFSTR